MKKETISLLPKKGLDVVENERIEESPFSICGNKEQGYVLTIGKNMISKRVFSTKEEAMDYCKPGVMSWNDLLVVTSAIAMHAINNQKRKEK